MAESIAERFARDIGPHAYSNGRAPARGHELTILHDDGLYRHLRCKSPDHSSYWFEILTAPGVLVFRGDGDSFVFERQQDMVAFFRDSGSFPRHASLPDYGVNPHYWSEKLTDGGGARRERVMRYDSELFVQAVKNATVEAIRYGSAPRGIGRAVQALLAVSDYDTEHDARRILDGFVFGDGWTITCSCGESSELMLLTDTPRWRGTHYLKHRVGSGHYCTEKYTQGFRFEDSWEWSFTDFDWWYLWACHAIGWAIARYDEARKAAPMPCACTLRCGHACDTERPAELLAPLCNCPRHAARLEAAQGALSGA